ncbi:MAG: kelch repeat-containing protein [Planctomycetota bacterium]|nr:kelch repeat-containing protein [Planctomycetota bacterium]
MMNAASRLSVLLPCALALTTAASHVAAQTLSHDKTGGANAAQASFQLQGNPNETYVIVFCFWEGTTTIPALGVTLDIPDTFAGASYALPGFFGNTNGSGAATASIAVPNDPGLESLVVSLQAVAGQGPFRVSNLVRLTPQVAGTWKPALNAPPVPIVGGTTAVAANHELLFAGGSGPVAQRYKSRTEQWEAAGATFGVGILSQSTGLADGRILFTGGLDILTGQTTNAAAVYDPIAQTTTTLTMALPRAGHGASLMGNGRVLITGGLAALDLQNPLSMLTGLHNTTEIFDPVTNTFAAGPNMLEARAMHSSTTLTNGQVLIAGGLSVLPIINLPNVSSTAYRFNPTTNSFGLPSFFSGARFLHSAVGLSNGKVLIAGGLTLDLTVFLQTLNIADLIIGTRTDCQLFTPSFIGGFGTFATVNGMQEGRAGAAIAPLPNGGALIAGGFRMTINVPTSTFELTATATTDRFAQSPNAITPTGPMAAARLFPVTVNLPDGTVMVVGGGPAAAEIYQQ